MITNLIEKPQLATFEDRVQHAKRLVERQGLKKRRQGFRYNFGTDENPNWQVLQLRAPTAKLDDEKNWMSSLSAYTAMVAIGNGATVGAKLKTESNQVIEMSYQDAMSVLLKMQGWCAFLVQTVWQKKDAMDALEAGDDNGLLALIADIPNGWDQ